MESNAILDSSRILNNACPPEDEENKEIDQNNIHQEFSFRHDINVIETE